VTVPDSHPVAYSVALPVCW